MKISKAEWNNYIKTMSQISDKASKEFAEWANNNGGWDNIDRQLLAEAAWSISSKYAEASSALAAEMYEAIANAENVKVQTAELSADVEFGQIAKAINGALKHSTNDDFVSSPVGRAVKQAGADTMLKNASRDGAEFAWIPAGDTCPFCLVLASNGWQRASKKTTNGNHAEHIHTNCDCQFAIRFDKNSQVEGYDPSVYQKMYYDAEGKNSKEKLKYLQAQYRQEKKNKDLKYKLSDNEGPFKTYDNRRNEDKKSVIKPHNIIENLNETSVGQKALEIINENNVKVELYYGEEFYDRDGNPIKGYYNPFDNTIAIFADKTKTVMETAKTTVHEAYHLVDYGPNQKSEVMCSMMELKHEKNTDELTKEEINDIINKVRRLYSYLPWE